MTDYLKPINDLMKSTFGSSTRGKPSLVAGERRDAGRSEAEVRRQAKRPITHYSAQIRMSETLFVGPDIDVDLDAAITLDGGVPSVRVIGVWIDSWCRDGWKIVEEGEVNLLDSDIPLLKALGEHIKEQAESDEDFCLAVIERDGWVYIGLGGNDPDGKWVLREE